MVNSFSNYALCCTGLDWDVGQDGLRPVCKQISPCVLLCVQVAAHGEGPAEAAAGPRQRAVGQQQSVGPGQNAGGDLPHLGETGSALIEGFIQETKTSNILKK